MARDYVTIREEQRDGQTVWTFNTVGHDRLKSAPAKVTRRRRPLHDRGRGLGRADRGVEVRVDDGPVAGRRRSTRGSAAHGRDGSPGGSGRSTGAAPAAGRARDHVAGDRRDGNVQPAPDDPFASKTYWESNGQITRLVKLN